MRWLGLDCGMKVRFFQMQRLGSIRKSPEKLIARESVPLLASKEDLDTMREGQRAHGGEKPRYDGAGGPSARRLRTRPAGGTAAPVSFPKIPTRVVLRLVKGAITVANAELMTSCCLRADGVPT